MLTHRAATILGDIPSDWGQSLLSKLLLDQKGGDWGDDDGKVAIRVLRSTNFTDRGLLDHQDVAVRYFSAVKAEKMMLRKDDILLERSGGGPTQPVGRVGFITEDLTAHWFSNFVQLLRPDRSKIDPEYLGWVLLELNRSGVAQRLQHQTTQMRNLDFRDYLRVYLPRPSPDEQKTIAKTLRTANEAMSAAEARLATARRLKTALMQQLFTRGIPGRHTRFQQTKIGEIPEGWEVLSIQRVLGGPPFSGVSPQSRGEPPGTPILNVSCIYDGKCDPLLVSYVDVDEQTLTECRARQGDFYVLRGNGNRELVGTGGLLGIEPDPPCIFSDKLIRLRFNRQEVVDSFMPWMWQSRTFLDRFQSKAESGSGLWMMSKREIRREVFAKPPRGEQAEIVALLDAAANSIDATESEVSALDRLKRSLLQNLLTGRVRVRT